MQMTGKTVLVTGASSGIGRATAILVSDLGARIILVGRNEAGLEETRTKLAGTEHILAPFDLTQTEAITPWIRDLSRVHGSIRGIAHAAGAHLIRPLQMVKSADVEDMLRLNVLSSLMLAKGFRQRGVNDEGGSIVYVSSVMGAVGAPGCAVYCASKGALDAMGKALALELAKDRIRVNCVAPGVVETAMTEESASALGEAQTDTIRSLHPLGFGAAKDVANAIAFLLSEAGRWITGVIQTVDGGYTAQ